MEFKTTSLTDRNDRRTSRGGTLIEYMIGMGIGGLVLTAVLGLALYSGRSFAGLANYVDLNSASVRALDQLSRDIRQMVSLTAYATDTVTFDDGSGVPLRYTYDRDARTLTRTQGAESKVLLKECDSLQFSIFQRTPMPGTYDQYPTATVANCKVVSVQWTCSRTILGAKVNTEDIQEAKIVIRKH